MYPILEALRRPAGNRLLILSKDASKYKELLTQNKHQQLPLIRQLVAVHTVAEAIAVSKSCNTTGFDIVLGEPSLIRSFFIRSSSLTSSLNLIQTVRWVQSTWAGVEPLLPRADNLEFSSLFPNHTPG